MKLLHDVENDVEHTIPPEGGPDSQRLFRAMTARSLAWASTVPGTCWIDLASGLGQDTLALARIAHSRRSSDSDQDGVAPLVIGVEPSNRMIRFGPEFLAKHEPEIGARFVRGLGEEIPLRSATVDSVLCKGAMDHFMDPALTMREIARVLRPGGRAVIAIANYDSLSCRLGRWLDRGNGPIENNDHPYYNPPPDHLTTFTHASIIALAQPPLRVRHIEGISLLWGFPWWGRLLQHIPHALQQAFLAIAYSIARARPAWADVVLLVVERSPHPARN